MPRLPAALSCKGGGLSAPGEGGSERGRSSWSQGWLAGCLKRHLQLHNGGFRPERRGPLLLTLGLQ